MKRDMELIRKILFKIEDEYNAGDGVIYDLSINGYSHAEVAEHCKILYQGGLISDYDSQYANGEIQFFGICNLTPHGYDYLELIRSEDIWQKANEEVQKKKLPQTIENIAKVAGIFIGNVLDQIAPK